MATSVYTSDVALTTRARSCPSASAEFEGRGAEELNNELARSIEHMLSNANALDLASLCLVPGRLCWIVYIDAQVLDSGGNLFDAISIAVRAALSNTRIPKVTVVEDDIEVSDDLHEATRIPMEPVPVCVTLSKIGPHYVVDTTLEEEICMSVRLTVGVNAKGDICAMQKGGRGGLPPSLLLEMLETARKIGVELIPRMDAALRQEESAKRPPLGFFAR